MFESSELLKETLEPCKSEIKNEALYEVSCLYEYQWISIILNILIMNINYLND